MKPNIVAITAIAFAVSGIVGCSQDSDSVAEQPATTVPVPAPKKAMKGSDQEATSEVAEAANESSAEPDMSLVEDAQSLMEKVKGAIATHDFDLARIVLEQLEGMKSMLPESIQNQIDSLQGLLATQKAASGNVPGMDAIKDKVPGMGQ